MQTLYGARATAVPAELGDFPAQMADSIAAALPGRDNLSVIEDASRPY